MDSKSGGWCIWETGGGELITVGTEGNDTKGSSYQDR